MKFQELYQTYPIIPSKKKTIAELSHLPKADLSNCKVQAYPKINYTELEFSMESFEIPRERTSIIKRLNKTRRWSKFLF